MSPDGRGCSTTAWRSTGTGGRGFRSSSKRAGFYYISLPRAGSREAARPSCARAAVRPLQSAARYCPGAPAPGRARGHAERRDLVPRLQVERAARPRLPPAAGAVGRRRLARVRRRRPDGRAVQEAEGRPVAADLEAGRERRLRRPDPLSAVAVEPQPRPGSLVTLGATRLAPPGGAARQRHDAGAEHAHREAVGRRRRRGGAPRRDRHGDGQRAGLAFISGSSFGWVGVGMRGGTRRIQWEQGEGPALAGGRRLAARPLLGGRRPPRVQPRRPRLDRRRGRVHARVRPLEGRAGRDLAATDAEDGSTSTPCAIGTALPRTWRSRRASRRPNLEVGVVMVAEDHHASAAPPNPGRPGRSSLAAGAAVARGPRDKIGRAMPFRSSASADPSPSVRRESLGAPGSPAFLRRPRFRRSFLGPALVLRLLPVALERLRDLRTLRCGSGPSDPDPQGRGSSDCGKARRQAPAVMRPPLRTLSGRRPAGSKPDRGRALASRVRR